MKLDVLGYELEHISLNGKSYDVKKNMVLHLGKLKIKGIKNVQKVLEIEMATHATRLEDITYED